MQDFTVVLRATSLVKGRMHIQANDAKEAQKKAEIAIKASDDEVCDVVWTYDGLPDDVEISILEVV